MQQRKTILLLLSWNLLAILQRNVEAGVMKRSSRMVREVYPEIEAENDASQAQVCIVGDVVYGVDEPVPAEQPCLKCRCQPPGVQCETIRCTKKPGCKAIHRSNKCCPDYQCECQHEGKSYANGERLKTPPGGECRVCYCRGGEVQCAEVSCYIRSDCEAKTVPGQCCPKYDHCPPKEPLMLERPYTTSSEVLIPSINQKVLELWPIHAVALNASSLVEELVTTTSSPLSSTPYDNQDENKITPEEKETVTLRDNKIVVKSTKLIADQPKITIQEIIPEIKEIPIIAPSQQQQQQPQGHLIIEEAELIDHTHNDLVVTDAEPDSSEVSEIFQQPPPVLRIGDKLLFLKKGGELISEKDASTPTSVITIIGAEGLQRGFEESGEMHEIRIVDETIPNETTSREENSTTKIVVVDDVDNSTATNDLEQLNVSESSHILSLIRREKIKNETITELAPITIITTINSDDLTTNTENVDHINNNSSDNNYDNGDELLSLSDNSTESDLNSTTETLSITTETIALTTPKQMNEEPSSSSSIVTFNNNNSDIFSSTTINTISTTAASSAGTIIATDSAIVTASGTNPAYPPIPDIMISQEDDKTLRFDNDNNNYSTPIVVDIKILPDVLAIRSNKTIPQNTSATHNEWLKKGVNLRTLVNPEAALPDDILNQTAPSDLAANNDDAESSSSSSSSVDDLLLLTTTEQYNDSYFDNTTMIISSSVPPLSEETTMPSSTFAPALTTLDQNVTDDLKDVETIIITDLTASSNDDRSVESVEDSKETDSGELTTIKSSNDHSAMHMSNENASIEPKQELLGNYESIAMLSSTSPKDSSSSEINTSRVTNTMTTHLDDVEVINNHSIRVDDDGMRTNTTNNPLISDDVEMIDTRQPSELIETKENKAIESSVTELLPAKTIDKRENSANDEADAVFKELDSELVVASENPDRQTDDTNDSDRIFKELLEETGTKGTGVASKGHLGQHTMNAMTATTSTAEQNKETEALQRVSDALTKFTLKGRKSSLDSSILGILTDFFSSQYKYYNNEKN